MPDFRCAECEEAFFERSEMPLISPCPACGAEDAVGLDLDEPEPPPLPERPAPDLRAEARRSAAELLAEHSIAEPPVDVFALALALGLRISYAPLGNVDGELRGERICLNRNRPRVRQRFTVAHELGHHRLHSAHGERGSAAERQADAFAGALLIPPAMLSAAFAEDPHPERLRRRFGVSAAALAIALREARLSAPLSA